MYGTCTDPNVRDREGDCGGLHVPPSTGIQEQGMASYYRQQESGILKEQESFRTPGAWPQVLSGETTPSPYVPGGGET